jgi:integrase
MRRRGTGTVYRQPGCTTWTIQFYSNGKRVRESTGETDYAAARQKLNLRLGQTAKGDYIEPDKSRTTVADLFVLLERDYRLTQKKSLRYAQHRWQKHVQPFFGHKLARNLRDGDIKAYIDRRLSEGAKPATINRETSLLRRMLTLGKIRLPEFEHLPEKNVRLGFVEDKDFSRLAAAASELWLRTFLEVAYTYGWRKAELLSLRVRQLDLSARTIRLDVGTTKNDEGREVTMSDAVHTLLQQCAYGKGPEDFVFTRADGKPVRDFRRAWTKLCTAAKLPDLLVHDLRRSAARAYRRAGVAESVIMKIGGWKTREIFERYNIKDSKDVAEAVAKREEKRTQELSHDFSHDSQVVAGSKTARLN